MAAVKENVIKTLHASAAGREECFDTGIQFERERAKIVETLLRDELRHALNCMVDSNSGHPSIVGVCMRIRDILKGHLEEREDGEL